jgi:hypothetical protein
MIHHSLPSSGCSKPSAVSTDWQNHREKKTVLSSLSNSTGPSEKATRRKNKQWSFRREHLCIYTPKTAKMNQNEKTYETA